MDVAAVLVNTGALLVALLGLLAFLKYPLNIGLIVAALNSVFLIVPMFLFVNFRPDFLIYAMTSFGELDPYMAYLPAQVITIMTAAAWLSGAYLAQHMQLGLPRTNIFGGDETKIGRGRAGVLVLICILLLGYFVNRGGISLLEVVSPSQKSIEDLYGSYWISTFLIYTPAILASLLAASRGRVGLPALLLSVFSVLMAFGTGQRRTVFLLAFIMFLSLIVSRTVREDRDRITRRIRKSIILFLATIAPLGPILWASRNYFAQRYSGVGTVTNPFEFRGFWELLFGSVATGYRTTIATMEMWQAGGVVPGYSLLYVFWAPIPRAIWTGKPISPDGVLQDHFHFWSNPSLFVVSEMVFSFYLLAPFAALITSYLLTRPGVVMWRGVCTSAVRNEFVAPTRLVMLAIYVSGSIVLFKNGIAPFVIFVLSTAAILLFVSMLTRVRPGKKRRR